MHIGKQKKNAGVSLFMSHREREHYDTNGDNFSEIPLIENNSLGANFFSYHRKSNRIGISNLN
jgi:outer membrane receptor for ferrienterochelin and colicins